ncbi:putative efflux protein, MATE family [Lachnospiraceae bacterium NE2001]|nr:putative efflux protein, MATE family [Lachnospiraceae bacterium NE2001]
MSDKKVIDFTTGNPAKHILNFYWPLLMTSMLQQLYNFVDVMIVGQGLGDSAFASVGNMSSIFFLIVGFSFGLANGFGVLIAQSFGAKDIKQLRHRLAGTIQLSVVLAILLTTFSVTMLPTLLRLMNTDPSLMKNCLKYGYIVFGGISLSICYNVSAAILRALGDSKTPLRAIIISSIINLGLDSFFIFVLHMGVESAAIATVVSQVISAIICINRLRHIEMIQLEKSDFLNDSRIYIDLFANGLPMAFMNSITAIGCMVVQHYINELGTDYTTAYSACSKYLNLFMCPAATAGNAMSAYTSQNYGAREYGRIVSGLKVCLTISFITYIVLGSVMTFFPEFLAKLLIQGDAPIRLVCEYLPICGMTIIAVDCLFVIRSAVQGMGHPVPPMWSGVLEMVLRIAVIVLGTSNIGFRAAAYAEIAAWVGALAVNVLAFSRILGPNLKSVIDKPGIKQVQLSHIKM